MSQMKSVLDKVTQFVAEFYGVEPQLVTPETDLDETLGGLGNEYIDWWEFVSYLGEEFNIEIPIEDAQELWSVSRKRVFNLS